MIRVGGPAEMAPLGKPDGLSPAADRGGVVPMAQVFLDGVRLRRMEPAKVEWALQEGFVLVDAAVVNPKREG